MKRVKNDWRCQLNSKSLDDLIRISLIGPELKDFDPKKPVQRWWLSGQRQKRPNIPQINRKGENDNCNSILIE